jgi:hypothetical protein
MVLNIPKAVEHPHDVDNTPKDFIDDVNGYMFCLLYDKECEETDKNNIKNNVLKRLNSLKIYLLDDKPMFEFGPSLKENYRTIIIKINNGFRFSTKIYNVDADTQKLLPPPPEDKQPSKPQEKKSMLSRLFGSTQKPVTQESIQEPATQESIQEPATTNVKRVHPFIKYTYGNDNKSVDVFLELRYYDTTLNPIPLLSTMDKPNTQGGKKNKSKKNKRVKRGRTRRHRKIKMRK